MSVYVSKFLNLRCVCDVLKIVSPLGKKAEKEISESMSIIKKIRKIALKYPMEYTLYDFCAGNALTSVLSAYLLPIKKAIAIDKKERKREWNLIKRFEYRVQNIFDFDPKNIEDKSIIIAIHPCGVLAERVIEIFKESVADYLFLMPCCCGKIEYELPTLPTIIKEKIDKYEYWCYHLYRKCKDFCENVDLLRDNKCLSSKNVILKAKK